MNSDGTSMALDPALAQQLLENGAVLVITGVPVGTEFGIDLCNYTVGENFRGVKMIPPGVHYIWCASKGPYGDVAPRVGFVYFFQAEEVVMREWNPNIEEMQLCTTLDAQVEKQRIRDNLKHLDKFLAPYDYRYYKKWEQLTHNVTAETVERCRPAFDTIRTNVELLSCPDTERPRGSAPQSIQQQQGRTLVDESELLPQLKPLEGSAPRFKALPERVPRNCKPEEVSAHSMDCVKAIDKLFEEFHSTDALIDEVQLAFVFYMVGYSVESLAHWRKILHLLSHSESAVLRYKLLYIKYSDLLALQLQHLPEELMEPVERNTIYKDVRYLLINMMQSGLNSNADKLANNLRKTLNWEFKGLLDEDPEDMPIVVETV